eukprot:3328267-Alexandrium_andersonii.AAC.1
MWFAQPPPGAKRKTSCAPRNDHQHGFAPCAPVTAQATWGRLPSSGRRDVFTVSSARFSKGR